MSKLLTTPKQSVQLDRVRIANMIIEDNAAIGQRWVEVYITLGKREIADDDASFQQYVDPQTGEVVFQYVKLEHGVHPLAPGQALGKCGGCGEWHNNAGGPCTVEGCEGTVLGYDGANRFILMEYEGKNLCYKNFKAMLYEFLVAEEVPHPVTSEMIKLLDIQV